jgi:RNA polymerase sigma factor (sigma-70 family)
MSKFIVPEGYSEAEVISEIERIISILAPTFKFGYYDVDDIKQEARIEAWKALARYDPSRPLANFLYTHVRNRLINLKRDKYHRNDPPCKLCHEGRLHSVTEACGRYKDWCKRNTSKQNIMNPLDLLNISDENEKNTRSESGVLDDIVINELLRRIDEELPVELRSHYLQMRSGMNIPKARRREVEKAILEILNNEVEINED